MIRVFIILFIFALPVKAGAQSLLANGSLTERNTCSEFSALCSPEAWFFIPTYVTLSKKEGTNSFEVLSMGTRSAAEGRRNYLYSKILCRLKASKKYKFTVWINTDDNIFDHLDIWLGDYEPGKKGAGVLMIQPTFTITKAQEDSSKSKWKKYSYVYTAKGGEQFIMLGNLSPEGMDKSKVRSATKRGLVLYGVDDIALAPVDTTEKVCPEYNAVLKQVYDQNKRHPSGFIEDIEINKSLIPGDTIVSKKEIVWVIVDTPPSLQKPLNDTLIIPDVLFLYNSSKLNPAFIKDLNKIIEKLKQKTFKELEITGHTDNIGSSAYNLKLSRDRANAIKDYLVNKLQLSPGTVVIKGLGETAPVAGNETTKGRQRNRRVEIILKN